MNQFVWENHYLLGNEKVDQQHKELFRLANRLLASKDIHALTENIMLLYHHVREHFQAEEVFMKQNGYPEYQHHVQTHNLMLEKLVEFSNDINQQQQLEALDVPGFMHDWIAHIVAEDAAINAYFASQQEQKSGNSLY
ncbi:hemerythrin family protein [Methylomonas sp. MO1]|uniref:bacteriohemerythrin n=1 Tax=Methylomonas sp. MO1 TaxID=3073619 RepID=UPI0028A427E1|nr:hemerythrin family protein [Methylomonas sp. MO1]MDT4292215.1 hemerythrin family protein [Methylomonas sp. MO1]